MEKIDCVDLSEDCNSSSNKSEEKSWKWKNFEKFNEQLRCNYCKKCFSAKTSHHSLKYHIKSHDKVKNNTTLQQFFAFKSIEKKSFEDYLLEFIINGQHSFRIVEEEGFIAMIKSLSNDIKIPTRKTLRSHAILKFDSLKEKLIQEFTTFNHKISLTTDIWTSNNMSSFMSITAHFIDGNFKIQNVLIDFSLIPYPHGGQQIMEKLREIITEFKIEKKLIALTSDNASNNIKAFKILKNWLKNYSSEEIIHFRCFAHIINLSIRGGIEVFKEDLENLRSLLSFIKSSVKKTELLAKTCETLKINYYKPKIDNITRWNSTFEMLECALKLKPAITYLLIQNHEFKDFKISEKEWNYFENLRDFLEPFKDATDMISGSKYESCPTIIPIFDGLIVHINQNEETNENLKICSHKIKEKLLEYEDLLKNDFCILSTILDPRFKLEYFKDNREFYKNSKELLLKIFEIYESKCPKITVIDSDRKLSFKESIFKKQKLNNQKSEIEIYVETSLEDSKIEPIFWWKINDEKFPILSKIAFDFLAIPATSVPSEQIFSKAGNTITKKRNRLDKNTVQIVMLLQSWNLYFKNK